MSKKCPLTGNTVLYAHCQECEEKTKCKDLTNAKHTDKTRIIIAGSRSFDDYRLLLKVMSEVAGQMPREKIEVISGGAKGADRLGEEFAKRNNLKLTLFPADWDKYGKSAGYRRNVEMAEYAGKEGMAVVFWDGYSRGAGHMIDIAAKKGMWLRIISTDKETYGKPLYPEGMIPPFE